jgi:hypothetical protein
MKTRTIEQMQKAHAGRFWLSMGESYGVAAVMEVDECGPITRYLFGGKEVAWQDAERRFHRPKGVEVKVAADLQELPHLAKRQQAPALSAEPLNALASALEGVQL